MTAQITDRMTIDGKDVYFCGFFPEANSMTWTIEECWLPLPTRFSLCHGTEISHPMITRLDPIEFRKRYDYSLILNPREHAAGAAAIYNSPDGLGVARYIMSTSCYRGYISFWQIKNGALYLTKIEGKYQLEGEGTPLKAEWFSGRIVVLEEKITSLMMQPISKEYRILSFNQGSLFQEEFVNEVPYLKKIRDEDLHITPRTYETKTHLERLQGWIMDTPSPGTSPLIIWVRAVLRRLALR